MSKAIVKAPEQSLAPSAEMESILANIVLHGDISQLEPQEKVQYYNTICNRLGIDPMLQPFQLIEFSRNGKKTEVLYASKSCTEQLRMVHGVSVTSMETLSLDGVFVVKVSVRNAKGRIDFGTGAVNTKGLSGDQLANALMKAETKAKRRATLSICGLGMLDETEIETIPNTPKPNELRGAPMELPEGLGKKIDDLRKNEKPAETAQPSEPRANAPDGPASPAKSPEPAIGDGNVKPVEKDTRLVDWKNKACEADPKNGEARFVKAFKAALEKRRVSRFDQLSKDLQDAVIREVRMVVEAMLPMPEGRKKGKLAEKFDALTENA